jgi:hypothetical protein
MGKEGSAKIISDPNVQASALLAVGSLLWKGISVASNIDFLLTINEERFKIFLDFLEGPGWILLTIAGIAWLFFSADSSSQRIID